MHQVLDEQQALSLSILKPDLHNLTKWPLTTSRRAVPHLVSQFVNGQASNNISKNDNNNNTNSHWTDEEAILSFSNTEEIVIPGELKVTIRWGERKKWIPTPRIQNETLNFIRKQNNHETSVILDDGLCCYGDLRFDAYACHRPGVGGKVLCHSIFFQSLQSLFNNLAII